VENKIEIVFNGSDVGCVVDIGEEHSDIEKRGIAIIGGIYGELFQEKIQRVIDIIDGFRYALPNPDKKFFKGWDIPEVNPDGKSGIHEGPVLSRGDVLPVNGDPDDNIEIPRIFIN